MSNSKQLLHPTVTFNNGRFSKTYPDDSGYSYPLRPSMGQTSMILGSEKIERAYCEICRSKKHTTVNGVCLDCARKHDKNVGFIAGRPNRF